MIYQCKQPIIKSHLLTTYAELCQYQKDAIFIQMSVKTAFVKILFECLHAEQEQDVRIKAAKIVMRFVRHQKKLVNNSNLSNAMMNQIIVDRKAIDQLVYLLGLSLGKLPPSPVSYITLLDVVLGRFRLETPSFVSNLEETSYENMLLLDADSGDADIGDVDMDVDLDMEHQDPQINHDGAVDSRVAHKAKLTKKDSWTSAQLVSHKDVIKLSGALEGLMYLIGMADFKLKTKILKDVLSMVNKNEFNARACVKQRNWDRWMVSILSLEISNEARNCNQLVSQICATLIWHQLVNDDKGYTTVLALLQTANDRIRKLLYPFHQSAQTNGGIESTPSKTGSANSESKKETDAELELRSPSSSSPPDIQHRFSILVSASASLHSNKPHYPEEVVAQCRVLHEYVVQVLLHLLHHFMKVHEVVDDASRRRAKSNATVKENTVSGGNNNNNNNGDLSSTENLSDISDSVKARLSKNLYVTLNVAEWSLMNHPFSMLHVARTRVTSETPMNEIKESMLFDQPFHQSEYSIDETKTEIEVMCLKKLLICTLKFLSFKQLRQLVLRRFLRFMKEVLPHPLCQGIFEDCVNAAKEFSLRLQGKRDANVKTMRIAYSFLKNAFQRFERRGEKARAKVIRQLQEDAFSYWNAQLFVDLDPNSPNSVTASSLRAAETQLERPQQHVHSLWIFFQHQHHWECIFHDDEMRRFRTEFEKFGVLFQSIQSYLFIYSIYLLKETKKIQASSRLVLKQFLTACTQGIEEMREQEHDSINEWLTRRRNERKDLIRELKKFMDFFDEEFVSRFPDENTVDYWEIDPRESENHTRLLLIRNVNGTDHPEATYENSKSLPQTLSKLSPESSEMEESATLMRRVSKHATHSDGNSNGIKNIETSPLLPEIMEDNDSYLSSTHLSMMSSDMDDKNHESQSTMIVNEDIEIEHEEWEMSGPSITSTLSNGNNSHHNNGNSNNNNNNSNGNNNGNNNNNGGNSIGANNNSENSGTGQQQFQKANIHGKILFEGTAINISPFYKIEGTVYITDTRFVFEGRKYLENVFQQNVVDQIKLKELKLRHLTKHTQDKDILKMLEMETQEQRDKLENIVDQIIEYDAWYLNYIRSILPRRYLLREIGIEMWIAGTHKSFFFLLKIQKKNEALTLICKHSQRLTHNVLRYVIPAPKKILKSSQLTQRWQKRFISNFDYLMELNVLAGRTYNDITQYPVFPWVLTNYASMTIDLNDPKNFRDLSKPIGALNPERLNVPPYHYATHYMSAGMHVYCILFFFGIALHYLVRNEPFTTLAINLQGGRFDIPDRLFHSLQNAWELSRTNLHDVKEVVPEMYYFPEMFRNINRLKLGSKQDGEVINDVTLPPWASTPEEFVRISREALESEWVSRNLHHWIDLIFGYKQRGQAAVDACNVFNYLTYAGAVDFETIVDPELRAATEQQIYHFGQTPNQLFDGPHVERLPKEECGIFDLIIPFKFHGDYKPIEMRTFAMVEQLTSLNVVRNGQCLKCFDMLERLLSFELPNVTNVDSNSSTLVTTGTKALALRTLVDSPQDPPIYELMSPDWSDCILYQSFVVSSNGIYGITSGYLDHSIKVHFLRTGEVLESVTGLENGHNDIITCLALASSQDMLVSGARDGSLVLWTINCKSSKPPRQPVLGKPYRLLSVHFDSVRTVEINTKLGVIVSAADDQTVALYSIARKRFVRQIFFNGREKKDHNDENPPLREIIKIVISNLGYIVVHTIEDTAPTLRVFSLNGILISRLRIDEILFGMVLDQSGKFSNEYITKNKHTFYFAFDGICMRMFFFFDDSLRLVQEIVVLENQRKKNKKDANTSPSGPHINISELKSIDENTTNISANDAKEEHENSDKRKVQFDQNIHSPKNLLTAHKLNTLTPKQTHSPAWRAQRLSILRNQQNADPESAKRTSISISLKNKRRSMLSQKRRGSRSISLNPRESSVQGSSVRRSTHFHGRFSSVDGAAVLSASHIIDLAIDTNNFFMLVAYLDIEKEECKLLYYPLPTSKYEKSFDSYYKVVYPLPIALTVLDTICLQQILENAQRSIWSATQKTDEVSSPDKENKFAFVNETLQNVKETSNKVGKVIGNVKSFFKRSTDGNNKE
ncbi:neurobeachin [Reticulomyxa filosa]|uniref:Neurobeachin n=1 Tax=Reticulomyxa filosa TaxID=46433 RepID=X6N164_RETFI|nr:neurobeachin [Reticulomyxa filosa]|eukprot:ETO20005.1 neurobeachin [Reticulomyxa filosa]